MSHKHALKTCNRCHHTGLYDADQTTCERSISGNICKGHLYPAEKEKQRHGDSRRELEDRRIEHDVRKAESVNPRIKRGFLVVIVGEGILSHNVSCATLYQMALKILV